MDITLLFTLTPLVVAAIPITVGLVQVVKAISLPDRFAPLASILIGCGLVALTTLTWQIVIAQGIIVGLCASGLWSGTKTTFQG